MSNLPQGWIQTTFADITNQRSGNSKLVKGKLESQESNGLYPAFSASGPDVWRDAFEYEGDAIIVSAVGARCGKAFRAKGQWSAIANTHIVWPEPQVVETEFLFLLLNDENFWEKGGSAQPFVKVRATFERTINLPPLPEQRRIVAKIDSLTGKSRRARDHLDHIPRLVEKYKQAILSAAFRADWPLISVGETIRAVVAGKNLRCEERPPFEHESGVVKVSAVSWGTFDARASKTLPESFTPPENTRIKAGDLLISRANTLELVGAVVIVLECPSNLFLSDKVLRLDVEDGDKPWLMWFLRSPDGRAAIEGAATGNQLSMRNLSQAALKSISMPWPAAEQREEIVSRIESAFAWIECLAADAASARKLIDHLDQSMLAKAFKGELVPQDPADEPASALLDRIRAERAAAPKAKRGRRKVA
ncbi:restriction endonuclease subunit S [Zymomonas mobilis]|uniref:Restriction modification system DNA specificity domain containing protein n=1 Tax=Zymomonas mobilis subsp. mobilis (strain ATCC 10988 / DSM 424 / LMG 404 / NCIMB 8938 / NRRL B-806 / ZM1) TaxID=555217 RepID=A0A0H3G4L8_ZYMMA|nr:restriction endonuclease subunit S [Zymomonas mobilis]AEH63585.1 restriction modification system DNA specificity domain containing protein [Zymomonas mobilis subsp. mobilis ATCC 10988]TQL24970.1 type I restriction enzyme S subunit [Zymomonas mobilis]